MSKSRLLTLFAVAMVLSVPALDSERASARQTEGRLHAAVYRHLCRAGNRDRERFPAVCQRTGRQAGRPRDRVRQSRRRVGAIQGLRQRQQADQARQCRCHRRHRPLRRRHGDGQGGKGKRHAADRPECRRAGGHGRDVCAEHLPLSFSNWQPGYAMGIVAAEKGYKKVVTITWKYAAGDESVGGFKESFEKGGGQGA